jgi:hypothetical protein
MNATIDIADITRACDPCSKHEELFVSSMNQTLHENLLFCVTASMPSRVVKGQMPPMTNTER